MLNRELNGSTSKDAFKDAINDKITNSDQNVDLYAFQNTELDTDQNSELNTSNKPNINTNINTKINTKINKDINKNLNTDSSTNKNLISNITSNENSDLNLTKNSTLDINEDSINTPNENTISIGSLIRKRKLTTKDTFRQKRQRLNGSDDDPTIHPIDTNNNSSHPSYNLPDSLSNNNLPNNLLIENLEGDTTINSNMNTTMQQEINTVDNNSIDMPIQINKRTRKFNITNKSNTIQSTRQNNNENTTTLENSNLNPILDLKMSSSKENTDFATRTNTIHEGKNNLSNAHTHIRSTAVFDYGGICKDFKKHGYCPFGDDCIYAHIREDYASGYEQDLEWERRKLSNKSDDNIISTSTKNNFNDSSICPLCNKEYKNPVITMCQHMFCKDCLLQHFNKTKKFLCPTCKKQTNGIMNTIKINTKFGNKTHLK